jgi:sortase A
MVNPGWRGLLAVGLFLSGAWLLGQGAYIEVKAWLAQYLLQQAWAETKEAGGRVSPWPWADTWPVARLRVDRLGVDQVVLAGASGRSLAFGPGHISGTAAPGAEGNSAISGHRDTHFRFLRELRDGDEIRLILPSGAEMGYRVYRRGVYQRDAVWLLERGEPGLTLITCYPFDALVSGGPERFVVSARPVLL